MKLSEMKAILEAENIRLTKSLGQNFLHDGNQLRRMIDAAELQPTDVVLEIGPGLGPVTELLLARVKSVLAIEKDQRLVEQLQKRLGSATNLELVNDDAVDYLRRTQRDWSNWKVVSNLPYSVGSRLLVDLARIGRAPERMVITVQLEVGQRLIASPDSDDYGTLSLLIQVCYEPRLAFRISASCFFPEPEIDSGCLILQRRPQPLVSAAEQPTFARLVKQSFGQRRKMMLKILKEYWPAKETEQAFQTVGLDPTVRGEQVSLEQFVQLTRILHPTL